MQNIDVIILAAGKGTRMYSSIPKVLHEVGSKSLLNHVITTAQKIKPKKIHLVVSEEISKIYTNADKNINFVIQKNRKGTADAISQCIPYLRQNNNKVLILYGDVPFIDISTIKKLVSIKKEEIKLLCFKKEEKNSYGKVILGTDGNVSEVIEQKELKKKDHFLLCNAGIFCLFTKDLKKYLPLISNKNKKKEFYATDIFKIATNNNINVKPEVVLESEVMGVNNKEDLATAEKALQIKLRQKFLKKGVTMIDPETVYLSSDTKIGKDVVLQPFLFIGPKVTIDNNTVIHSFSHLENCRIGKNVQIGPYARIRPGTQLMDESKVGNFVEIKNSKINKKSKVNHLSYVGDSNIGQLVNVGAGTITCNYDGSKKHQTKIEDGAFIGSNSSLVAPVTIGKNAYVGSGSTITKDVKANSLAVERSIQMSVKNWSKRKKK